MYIRRGFIIGLASIVLVFSVIVTLRLQTNKQGILENFANQLDSYGYGSGHSSNGNNENHNDKSNAYHIGSDNKNHGGGSSGGTGNSGSSKIVGANDTAPKPCVDDLEWIDSIDVVFPVKYARRNIIIKPSLEARRASITKVDESLFGKIQTIDPFRDPASKIQKCQDPLILDVPAFPETRINASHLYFGMATTLERLEDTIPSISRWLAYTQAKLFVIIRKPEEGPWPKPEEVSQRQARLRKDGLDVSLVPPMSKDEIYTENFFSLAKIMYSSRKNNTEWFILMDDDTFFPSMTSLVSMLRKYDATQQYYVGGLSEKWWSVARYGYMAFGGAGIFLSRALAKTIDQVYETCQGEMHKAAGGDERVMRCVYEHTDIKLTNEPGLHQMDIGGDYSGIYESGRILLSLHHWKGGSYPVDLMSLVADICGDCVFQRWLFRHDTVLSNGYSIATYPKGEHAEGLDFHRAEETWTSDTVEQSVNPGTAHSLSPARPKLALDEEKIQYKLLESAIIGDCVRQSYVHRGKDGEMDTLLVLFWSKGKVE
ncbi:MAG: hypothetical protein LQ351_007202 [Letrouitia transgressa]|nr:MAG: hypothetical protein LQ351_007202 [Letrouitia transgressa]